MRKLLFYLFLLPLWLVACQADRPQLVLGANSLDLGQIPNGQIVSREIKVENQGAAPLIVSSVSSSCGCTEATLEPMTLPPGTSGILHIRFDSGAHGPDLTGPLVRQVFLNSNDPQQPEALVEVTVDILPASAP